MLIGADLLRSAAPASVPIAATLDALTYAQLCVVAFMQTAGTIVFNANSGAHLTHLITVDQRVTAASCFETSH